MDRFALLDASPFGLACCHPSQPATARCLDWLDDLRTAGYVILIPAIADYEVRRELIRVGTTAKLGRLSGLRVRYDGLDITT